jgi:hypothetical protein
VRAPSEQVEQITQSKFVCSACGSGRDCDCAAPALERLAEIKEQARQRQIKKREQEKPPRHVTEPDDAAASAEARKAAYAAGEPVAEGWQKKIALGIIDQAYHQVAEVRNLLLAEMVDDRVIEEIRHTVNEWRSLLDAAVETRASVTAPPALPPPQDDLGIPDSLKRT